MNFTFGGIEIFLFLSEIVVSVKVEGFVFISHVKTTKLMSKHSPKSGDSKTVFGFAVSSLVWE